jgi:hypothetical protein
MPLLPKMAVIRLVLLIGWLSAEALTFSVVGLFPLLWQCAQVHTSVCWNGVRFCFAQMRRRAGGTSISKQGEAKLTRWLHVLKVDGELSGVLLANRLCKLLRGVALCEFEVQTGRCKAVPS